MVPKWRGYPQSMVALVMLALLLRLEGSALMGNGQWSDGRIGQSEKG
jgi:hypothetical protein